MPDNVDIARRYLARLSDGAGPAIASGEQVAMEVVWTATIRQAAGPFSAGQSLRARFAIFMEFRDGLIARQRNYDCFDPW